MFPQLSCHENTEVRNCKTCTKKWPKSQRNKNQWLFFLLLLLSSCCSAILSYYEKGENIKLVIGIQIIQWMCMYIIFFFFFTQVRNQILRLACWLKCQHFIWKSESKIGQKVDLMLHCIIKSNVLTICSKQLALTSESKPLESKSIHWRQRTTIKCKDCQS